MTAEVMKVEMETETCCVCGGGGELLSPEEHDAGAPPMQVPLRTMLVHLNSSKVVPEGRLCGSCIRRTLESYEFSTALSSRGVPPLSEKIRALRRRLHELTQKIDVFIVVGGAGAGGAYSEEDIIMVERDTLAAAAAADDDDLERARNARGDSVYQCSVCPLSFQRVAEYRAHCALHAADALHSCWTCGAQFLSRAALRAHAGAACGAALCCALCGRAHTAAAELRRHEASCPPRCPACGVLLADRAALAAHCVALHGRTSRAPHVCPQCSLLYMLLGVLLADRAALAAHCVALHGRTSRAPHVCPQCSLLYMLLGVLLADRAALAAHCVALHGRTSRAPHVCPQCSLLYMLLGVLLADRAALAAHCVALHGRTSRAPHVCPQCSLLYMLLGVLLADRAALAAHCVALHGRTSRAPHVCPQCFRTCDTPELLSAHLLRHRQAKQFVCGYDGCILRFGTRSNLMAHIRKCHSAAPADEADAELAAAEPAASCTCDHCGRTFGSAAAMKRHSRVHRAPRHLQEEGNESQEGEDMEGEVEYLEVEELEDAHYRPGGGGGPGGALQL